MRQITGIAIALFVAMFTRPIPGEDGDVTQLDLETLSFELPPAIRLRVEMIELGRSESAESKRSSAAGGFTLVDKQESLYWFSVHRAWDGLIFLTDDLHMALWVRDDAGWKCVVHGVRVFKTFGGMLPWMPVRYLGDGLFAVSETLPGDLIEDSKHGIPQARAATFLIDSKDCTVKERSKSFVYDHNPPVVVPEEWTARYKIKSSRDDAGQPSTEPGTKAGANENPNLESKGRLR